MKTVMLMGAAHAADVARGTTAIAGKVENCLGNNDISQVTNATSSEDYVAGLQAAETACVNR